MTRRGNVGAGAALVSPPWRPALLLVAAVVLAYGNTLSAPFLFDDAGAVQNNASIRRLMSLDVFNPPADGSTTTGRPVVNLSFAINYAIGGESVTGYHVVNLAIHALSALTLMGLLRRTFMLPALRERLGPAADSLAIFVALLWAVHPLQSESVVCIAQRTELLCGLFYLLTLYALVRSVEGRMDSRRWLAASVAACLAGMGSKEVMVTAPLVALLYDRTFVAGSVAEAWRRRRGYYLALAGTWLLLAWLVVRGGGTRGVAAGFGLGVSGRSYLLKQGEALVLYLERAFWPHPLVLDYGMATVASAADVWWQGAAVLILLAVSVWAWWRRPMLGFAGIWFFLVLAPSSSFVPLVTQTMAEHRMYLPLAGVLALVGAIPFRRIGPHPTWLAFAAVVVLIAITRARSEDYRDELVLWAANVRDYPRSARAQGNLAWTLQQRGKAAQANDHFARAVALDPGYVTARYNWGVALLRQGRTAEAIAQFEAAIRLEPRHADAHVNLGNALFRAQRIAEAIPRLERALELRPAADAHYNLGVALSEIGRRDEAAKHLRDALRLEPTLAEAHFQLGRLAEQSGRLAEAERHYAETLRFAANHAGALRRLGLLLARTERLALAAAHFETLIRLTPDDADAHANLGNVLLLQDRPREALARYEEALRLRPDDPRTRENIRVAREALR